MPEVHSDTMFLLVPPVKTLIQNKLLNIVILRIFSTLSPIQNPYMVIDI